MKKLFVILSFLVVVVCFTAQARADSSWTFDVTATILDYSLDVSRKQEYKDGVLYKETVDSINRTPDPKGNFDERLSWGVKNHETGKEHLSYFDLLFHNEGVGYTIGDDPLTILEFVHRNRELDSINGNELLPYPEVINIQLSFRFENTEGDIGFTNNFVLQLGFVETNNSKSTGLPFDDIFFFIFPEALKNPIIAGDYVISVDTGFQPMDDSWVFYDLAWDAAVRTLGASEGDVIWGWQTEEKLDTPFLISFEITKSGDTDVPEPASMLFLGGSLAGFGLIRRYRIKRKQNA